MDKHLNFKSQTSNFPKREWFLFQLTGFSGVGTKFRIRIAFNRVIKHTQEWMYGQNQGPWNLILKQKSSAFTMWIPRLFDVLHKPLLLQEHSQQCLQGYTHEKLLPWVAVPQLKETGNYLSMKIQGKFQKSTFLAWSMLDMEKIKSKCEEGVNCEGLSMRIFISVYAARWDLWSYHLNGQTSHSSSYQSLFPARGLFNL